MKKANLKLLTIIDYVATVLLIVAFVPFFLDMDPELKRLYINVMVIVLAIIALALAFVAYKYNLSFWSSKVKYFKNKRSRDISILLLVLTSILLILLRSYIEILLR